MFSKIWGNWSARVAARLVALFLVTAGIQGIAGAPPAAASTCQSECGDVNILGQMFPRPAGYGERITAQGSIYDTSASCKIGGLCEWPEGYVQWYIDDAYYQQSYLRIYADCDANFDCTEDSHNHSLFGPMYLDGLDAGDYVMKLHYEPGNFSPETETFNLHVNQAGSNPVLTQQSETSPVGEPTTFTVTVSGIYNGEPQHVHSFAKLPQGTVELFDGGAVINVANVVDGVATFTLPFEGAYEHQLTARYDGDTNYEGGVLTAPVHHTFTKAPATNTLTVAPAADTLPGEAVTLTSTVAPASAANTLTPTGSVTFVDRTTGATIATVPLDAHGVASATRSFNAGTHDIEATYPGDGNFLPATASATHDVDKGSVTTSIGQSAEPTVWGQPFDFASNVAPVAPSTAVPQGTITFFDGTTQLGTRTLGTKATPTITVSNLEVGSHKLNTAYSGDGNYNSATAGPLAHTVNKGDVDVIGDQSKETTVYGEQFTLRALVRAAAPAAGITTGTVTFTDTSTGDLLGTAPLDATGQASLPVTLGVGDHNISVAYGGDGHFNRGGGSVQHRVDKAPTAATVSSPTAEPSSLGDAVTLRVAVAAVAPGAGVPTGMVQFRDGARLLGNAVALANGAAEIVVPAFAGGRHDITALYAGDANFLGATSPMLRRTVTCDKTVTGSFNGASLDPRVTTCFVNATVPGQVTIPAGARVSIVESTFDRVVANQPGALIACGTRVNTSITVTRATGLVSLGDPYFSACRQNQIADSQFSQNQRGVRLLANAFSKDVFVMGTSGGPTLIGGNTVTGTLACNNNNPAATNGGYVNTASNRKGECATLDLPPSYQQP